MLSASSRKRASLSRSAFSASQGERILPGRAALETLPHALEDAPEMLGVVNALPTPALHLFGRCSRVVVPAFVIPVSAARRVGHPGERTHVVGKIAKARLAFAQRLLAGGEHRRGTLALGNVLGHDVDADDSSIRASQRMPVGDPHMV